jgi:hypothetical protein
MANESIQWFKQTWASLLLLLAFFAAATRFLSMTLRLPALLGLRSVQKDKQSDNDDDKQQKEHVALGVHLSVCWFELFAWLCLKDDDSVEPVSERRMMVSLWTPRSFYSHDSRGKTTAMGRWEEWLRRNECEKKSGERKKKLTKTNANRIETSFPLP